MGTPTGAAIEPDHLRAALDVLDDALVVVDRDLAVLYANARFERELGTLPATLRPGSVDETGSEVLRTDGSPYPIAERPLIRALRDGVPVPPTVLGLRRDGTTCWVEVSARPLLGCDRPEPYAAVATFRDVTAAVTAERAIAESESHFRLLAENSTDAIQRYSAAGTCLYTSPAITEVLGWQPEELLGTTGRLHVHPDDLVSFLDHSRELVRTRTPQLLRYRALHADGSWVWVDTLSRAVAGPDGRVLEFQTSTRDATDRVEAEDQLARLARTDALTGLVNRAALVQHLDDRLAGEQPLALLFLDLDRFKAVNDSLGHRAGDELLRVVARRLTRTCRENDVVARLGGDEFVVLATLDVEGAVHLAERLQRALAPSIRALATDVTVSASVGVVVADRERGDDAERLLHAADLSMYRAKTRGRARAVVWTEELGAAATNRLGIRAELRTALRDGGLRVHYQPQLDLATGCVVGVEALVRWQHPRRGLLLPGEFLDVANESGLVVELGRSVLASAARQVAAWRLLPGCGSLGLSVNVSAEELQQPDLLTGTLAALDAAGLPPSALTVEVLEDALLDSEGTVAASLAGHVDAGIRLALDDFGTGSSSLLHLREVPVGAVKVDRAFVAGLGRSAVDEAIVRAVGSLTRDLGLVCVAEGVETAEQASWLLAEGIGLAQGFGLHPPLEAAAVSALLLPGG